MRVGIVGGGIAGLTLATRLVRAGHSTLVLDKGRGLGGRTATRRGDGLAFDHGAQYFTARDPKFLGFLHDHVPDETWAPWPGRFASLDANGLIPEDPPSTRFVGVPGMSSIARALAEGLETTTETRVIRLAGSAGRWSLIDEDGLEHGPFDWLVATAPPVQSAAILGGSSPIAAELARVAMQPCFALMVAPPEGAGLPFDGIRCRHPVLGWAANDHSKPGRGPGPAVVIHSDHGWAEQHRDDDPSAIAGALLKAASDAFGVDLGPAAAAKVHRWLYARPAEPLGRPCLLDREARLAACGDWCLAAKVEGAFLAGDACAGAILV